MEFDRLRRFMSGYSSRDIDRARELERRKDVVTQMKTEHNNRAELANLRLIAVREALYRRSDRGEIMPILDGYINAAKVERDGLWMQAVIDTGGDVMAASVQVNKKVQKMRDDWFTRDEISPTPQE